MSLPAFSHPAFSHNARHPAPSHPPTFDGDTLAALNQLRLSALTCRARARVDLFKACALLSFERGTAQAAYAEILMRCLPQALGHSPVLYRPGESNLSFDEAWLARLIESARSGDQDSFRFLLAARVAPLARRNLSFLIRGIADSDPLT